MTLQVKTTDTTPIYCLRASALACATAIMSACGGVGSEEDANATGSSGGNAPAVTKVTFSQLVNFSYEVNWEDHGKNANPTAYALRVPQRVRNLNKLEVDVEGYMLPIELNADETRTTEFLLLPDTKACCYGVVPEQNGWVVVKTNPEGVATKMDQLLRVRGVLQVAEKWSETEQSFFTGLYHLTCKRVLVL